MRRNFKYRLYPNQEQTRRLARVLEIHRQLYNAALLERRAAWRKCAVSLRRGEACLAPTTRLARELVNTYSLLVVEDLNLDGDVPRSGTSQVKGLRRCRLEPIAHVPELQSGRSW